MGKRWVGISGIFSGISCIRKKHTRNANLPFGLLSWELLWNLLSTASRLPHLILLSCSHCHWTGILLLFGIVRFSAYRLAVFARLLGNLEGRGGWGGSSQIWATNISKSNGRRGRCVIYWDRISVALFFFLGVSRLAKSLGFGHGMAN